MFLESKDIIPRPLEEVYQLVRDNMPKVVPYLPNIEKIEVVEKADKGDMTHITNHWYAKAEVPKIAKKFIRPELFAWKDHAVWDNPKHLVKYELESFWANDIFDAVGTNYFKAVTPEETELHLTCEVKIYPNKVPGVPAFLARKALPHIEEMIKKMLRPNLTSLGEGIVAYFEQNS